MYSSYVIFKIHKSLQQYPPLQSCSFYKMAPLSPSLYNLNRTVNGLARVLINPRYLSRINKIKI